MSFSLDLNFTDPSANFEGALLERYSEKEQATQLSNGTDKEASYLIACAGAHVAWLQETLGDWAELRVTIVGHANPGHAARSGWSNEFLNVNVSVVSYK